MGKPVGALEDGIKGDIVVCFMTKRRFMSKVETAVLEQ